MAQTIIYCERCGKMIPLGDPGGAMVLGGDLGVCADCLSPDERERIRRMLAGGGRAGGTGAPASAAGPTLRAGRPKSRTSRRTGGGAPTRRAGGGTRTGLLVAGIAAGALAGVAIAVLLLGGRGPANGRPEGASPSQRPGAVSSPAVEPRGSAGRRVPGGAPSRGRAKSAEVTAELPTRERTSAPGRTRPEAVVPAPGGGADTRGGKETAAEPGEAESSRAGRREATGEGSDVAPGETIEAKKADEAKRTDAATASAGAATPPPEPVGAGLQVGRTNAPGKEAWQAFLLGLADAGGKGLAEAKSYLLRRRAEMKKLGLADGVRRIEKRFHEVRLVEDLAEIGFQNARGTVRIGWKGGRLAGKIGKVEKGVLHIKAIGGRSLEVPICEVGAEDVVRYSQIMRSATSGAKDRVKAATYCFLRGEPEAAQKYLKGALGDRAWELGDDVNELAQLVEARRKRESAAAKAEAAVGTAAGRTAKPGALTRSTKPARKKVPVDFQVKDVETYRCPKPTTFANVFSFGYGGDQMPKDDARFEALLTKLKAGGFNTVHCTHTDARLALCRKRGIKMMIDLLAADEGQHVYKTVETVEALCRKLRGNGDLWGYGIWHDPFGKMVAGRKRDISNVRRWDPTHPAYCGTYRTGGMSRLTNPDVFGFYDFHWKRNREYHFPHLLRFRKWAIERNAYVYRWLATDSGRAGLGNYNRSLYTATTSIACGVKGVIWFLGTRLMDRKSLEWTTNGRDIMKVNREIMPLAEEIPRLGNPVAVYSTPFTRTANDKDLPDGKASMMPPGLEGSAFPTGFWITPEGGEFVMGVFRDGEGRDAVFVANNNAYQVQDVKLRIAAGRRASVFDRKSRSWRALRASRGVISFKLAEAGGELVRFEK